MPILNARTIRRRARPVSALAFILLGVVLFVSPALPQVAPTLNISNSPALFSTSPRIVTDSQGNVHAVWVEQPIGSVQEDVRTGDVYYAMGSLGTLQLSVPINISNINTVWCDTLEMCSIDVDGQDRVYVVWTEGRRVVLRIKTGSAWGAGFVVASGPVYDAPRVAVAPNGDIFIIYWTNEGHVFSRARINGVWEEEQAVGRWDYRTKLADIAIGTSFVGAVWVERPSADQSANYQTAYAQRTRTFNGAWSDSVQVAPSGYNQQHAAVELDSGDVPHAIWTNEVGGARIVYHARRTGSSFLSPTAISASELLHYPFVAERGDDLYACWQVGGYRQGSSIDFNIRENGAWKAVDAVPSSNGSTYADIAVTPDQGILFVVWDVDTLTYNGEIFGWAKSLTTAKTVSGTVTTSGAPLPNVVISGLPGNPVTNAAGQYASTVSIGWSGTATPTLSGYIFTPGSRTYANVFIDQVGQDYLALPTTSSVFAVTSPNGGETWLAGSTHAVRWTTAGSVPNVKIEFSTDGGASYGLVTASASNTGSYSWTLPITTSTACLVKVSDPSNTTVFDVCNAFFTITQTAFVKKNLLGTWDGQGTYYRSSDTGQWKALATPADLIGVGDLDADSVDDLIGVWPGQGGVWAMYSKTGIWGILASSARHLASGDMDGDGKIELLGTWDNQGVYRRDAAGNWIMMAVPATMITACDLDGDGSDDLAGVWPSQAGMWAKMSQSGTWSYFGSTPRDIAAGDMNGDGRADLIGTWDGQGVYYRDTITGVWVMIASAADQITAGDLDGDGTDDLIGIWAGQAGVWVKYSTGQTWTYIGSSARDIAAGKMSGGVWGSGINALLSLDRPMGGYPGKPGTGTWNDESAQGPGGASFLYQSEPHLVPPKPGALPNRIPGPGELGFAPIQQKNLEPGSNRDDKASHKR